MTKTIHCPKKSSSMETSIFARSDPVHTNMPAICWISHFKLIQVWPAQRWGHAGINYSASTQRNDYALGTMNGWYRRSIVFQWSAKSNHEWAQKLLSVRLVTGLFEEVKTPCVAMKLNLVTNIGSALVLCEAFFVGKLTRGLIYSPIIIKEYRMPFLETKTT